MGNSQRSPTICNVNLWVMTSVIVLRHRTASELYGRGTIQMKKLHVKACGMHVALRWWKHIYGTCWLAQWTVGLYRKILSQPICECKHVATRPRNMPCTLQASASDPSVPYVPGHTRVPYEVSLWQTALSAFWGRAAVLVNHTSKFRQRKNV